MAIDLKSDDVQLGRILVEMRALDPDELDRALAEHMKTGERLGTILTKMSLVSEEDVLQAVAKQMGLRYAKLTEMQIPAPVIERVPARLVTHYEIMPVGVGDGIIEIAMSDPNDVHLLDDLRLNLRAEIEPVVASYREISAAIKKYYGIGADTMEDLSRDETDTAVDITRDAIEDIETMAEDASIVRFVNQIVKEAIGDRATDIHIEPQEDDLRVRYRIDGVLYESPVPPNIKRFQAAIISRVKIMADMDIAERRLPLDGKIKIKMGSQDFDMRVSTVPTPAGESVSIRLLSRDEHFINLENLGFDDDHLGILRDMISRPHGIVLVTGPTGSGKSTTLYASLSEINTAEKKLITIEDPIEYRMKGVTQIQVNPGIGLNFARCLRAILRQDPDILLVGEIRDPETAEISIQSALTGHLVFSTLHTNDACGAVTRLMDMGIEPFLISSSLEGLIAQRLVRVLCPQCKTEYDPPKELLDRVNLTAQARDTFRVFRPRGCEACRYTGYRGRTAVYEMVEVKESFRRLIVDGASTAALKAQAVKMGMTSLRHDGWTKIKKGLTSVEEVLRVTMEEDLMEEDKTAAAAQPAGE